MFSTFLLATALLVSDDDVLRSLLESAATSDRATLESTAARIQDAALREKTLAILDDLLRSSARSARGRVLEEDLKALKGAVAWEPGGPAWLRERVGDAAMKPFDRLVKIDLNDRSNPHAKDYRLNTAVNDAWLEKLAGFVDVRSLDLANADVKGPGLKHVGTLRSLESLNLTLTPITDDALPHLATLTKLKVLGLASTQVTGTGVGALAALPIENLNCHFTPVNDAGLAEISKLTRLLRLEIVHCKWTDEGAKHLASLKTLQRLQMGSRAGTGRAVASLKGLSLRELDLHDGQPTLEGLKAAGEISSLVVLRVYGGNAKDEGLRALAGLEKLESLVVEGVGATEAAVAELKQSRPKLDVVRR